ncbi:MAG: DMT family transporter [Lachnospiraceae bacterium]
MSDLKYQKRKARNTFMLLLTALIWGCAFVAQSVGMNFIGPFTFSAVRSAVGCLFLLGYIALIHRHTKSGKTALKSRKQLVIGGFFCGFIMFAASNLQQFGILYSGVGKAGFITALYIVFVPLIGILLHRKHGKRLWLAVALALVGLYLLCVKSGNLYPESGDILLILCAVIFAVHILLVDRFTNLVDGVWLSCIQFFVCALLSAIAMFFVEEPQISAILLAWKPILYAGILSSGIAYTLQIVGQKGLNPVIASLIMSLESVFAALAGWFILGETLSVRELIGCGIVFAAIILAQIPDKSRLLPDDAEELFDKD